MPFHLFLAQRVALGNQKYKPELKSRKSKAWGGVAGFTNPKTRKNERQKIKLSIRNSFRRIFRYPDQISSDFLQAKKAAKTVCFFLVVQLCPFYLGNRKSILLNSGFYDQKPIRASLFIAVVVHSNPVIESGL